MKYTGKVTFCGLTADQILALKAFYLEKTGRLAETILDKPDAGKGK